MGLVWAIAHLLAVLIEETRGVHAIRNGAADDGKPVENQRRLVGVPKQHLLQDVDEDRYRQ